MLSTEVPYLGVAELDTTFDPNDVGQIRLDMILQNAWMDNLSLEQGSNLLANVVAHETGHLMGLDHTGDQYDVMHNGATEHWEESPPIFFHDEAEAITVNALVANEPSDVGADGTDRAARSLGEDTFELGDAGFS